MLPPQITPAFEGVIPSTIITLSADGVPNIANLSRVWMIDREHVAVANQMLNKTVSNLNENASATLKIANPNDLQHWELGVRVVRSETEGPLYDAMRRDLRAISWMAGADNLAPLRSVLLFQVLSVRKCVEESHHLLPVPELYVDLLQVLADVLQWDRTSYWFPSQGQGTVQLIASRGVPGAGTDTAALEPMERLASLVESERQIVRLRRIRSQLRYLHTVLGETDKQSEQRGEPPTNRNVDDQALPVSFLGIPVTASDELIGILCCEAAGPDEDAFDRFGDPYVLLLSRKLGEALAAIDLVPAQERKPHFRQLLERAKLEWARATEPFHTALSARERQVSVCVANGLTNAEIAKTLFVSTRTVTTHLERIYQKLQVSSRAALTRYVMEKGLLEGEAGESFR